MKIKIISILLLLVFVSNAQIKFQGEITYISQAKKDKKYIQKRKKKMTSYGLSPTVELVRIYTLQFTKKESVYASKKIKETLGKKVYINLNPDMNIYKNLKLKKYMYKDNILNKKFFIVDELKKYNWQLTQETKKIGTYTCYKAFFTKENDKKKKITVTAWYTPQIPISNGPGHYGGLPGLILQIQYGMVTVACSKILINSEKKIELKKPFDENEEDIITQKEFDEIQKEKSKEGNVLISF